MKVHPSFIGIALGLSLAACATYHKAIPVPTQVDPSCFQSIVDDVRWTGDPADPSTWDVLGGDVVPRLREKVALADAHRLACVQALNRLDKAKVISLGK